MYKWDFWQQVYLQAVNGLTIRMPPNSETDVINQVAKAIADQSVKDYEKATKENSQ